MSFRYPGTERLVLDDVTLDLPAGAVVAIVGENGAGKSTLVKLVCKLYAPTEGRIEVDGVDLSEFPALEWRSRLAGRVPGLLPVRVPARTTASASATRPARRRPVVETAVGRAGADDVIERLALGLDTQLGPTWDEGVEVSFGQWQKLALRRAGSCATDPLVLVLDEPTAALDAETEHALFERYANASRTADINGRVTILVSAPLLDRAHGRRDRVIDGARVVEVGSHSDLMAKRGTYSELYKIQADAFSSRRPSSLRVGRDDPDVVGSLRSSAFTSSRSDRSVPSQTTRAASACAVSQALRLRIAAPAACFDAGAVSESTTVSCAASAGGRKVARLAAGHTESGSGTGTPPRRGRRLRPRLRLRVARHRDRGRSARRVGVDREHPAEDLGELLAYRARDRVLAVAAEIGRPVAEDDDAVAGGRRVRGDRRTATAAGSSASPSSVGGSSPEASELAARGFRSPAVD